LKSAVNRRFAGEDDPSWPQGSAQSFDEGRSGRAAEQWDTDAIWRQEPHAHGIVGDVNTLYVGEPKRLKAAATFEGNWPTGNGGQISRRRLNAYALQSREEVSSERMGRALSIPSARECLGKLMKRADQAFGRGVSEADYSHGTKKWGG
jgi:hypothetical protein